MTNEYGAPLDQNGYAPSILQEDTESCFICLRNGHTDPLDRHEIFGGALRGKSKRLGLWVSLCHTRCHQGPQGAHGSAQAALALKRLGQRAAMERYGWDTARFIAEFGKNYLTEDGNA